MKKEMTLLTRKKRVQTKPVLRKHVFTLNSIIKNKMANNQSVYAAFTDLRKAFDCVNRDLLYLRMFTWRALVIDGTQV